MGIDLRVVELAAEFDLRIVGGNRHPAAGETRAVNTLIRILNKRGEGHLRLVLSTLMETDSRKANLTEPLLWATSDLVRACEPIIEARTSDWLELWDLIPIDDLQRMAQRLHGKVHQRYSLAGMLYKRVFKRFEIRDVV